MKTKRFFYYGKFVVLGFVALAAFTFAVMWLWNWLVPALFKGPELTYWQTLGVLLLSKIIFTGIGGGKTHHHPEHGHYWSRNAREEWRRKFREKMNNLSEKQEQAEGETSG